MGEPREHPRFSLEPLLLGLREFHSQQVERFDRDVPFQDSVSAPANLSESSRAKQFFLVDVAYRIIGLRGVGING